MDKKKLLYIEDDLLAQDIVRRVLSKEFDVDLSDNAAAALEQINKVHYNGFLIDIHLGRGMDGIELFQKIKTLNGYEDTPAVALTAYAADSDRDEFLSKGFNAYLSKPFSLNDLRNVTDRIFK